ncbi:putative E3 ubiquitin-protein ligase TRIML1 [Phascolarctos cinereus]|uniref:Probable E3 ubiquitin-protein ligase TRIML1 n=1 Tax=Phascolarctos cinereus TaxID=38626 RepID=A0A6P5KYQ5_PHACI|nr:probable E3 ubiquitin-protein ligase TRIML1 [Phascolarctos cinereus]
MAAAHLAENLKEELTCPVCMDYFSHPVTLGCGHTFCHLCLLKNSGEADQPSPCPECKRTFPLRDLERNRCLEKLASIARNVKPLLLKIKEENTECNRHRAEQNLFCEEDQALLCAFCFQTPEHSRHTVRPIEKAAEDSRDKLQKISDLCWKEMETIEKMLIEEREKEKSCKEKGQAQRESLAEEYRRFHELLMKEEQRRLEMLARQENYYLKSIRESEVRLSQHLQSLKEVILEIEQNYQKPNVQLLQMVGDALFRCESLLSHRPETVTTPGIFFYYTLIWEMLKYFKADVTLDPESACPHLIVSADLKTVVHGGYQQTVTFTPGRFKDNIILGAQIFVSGIHYWEVDVGDTRQWTVGVCKESLSRDGNVPSAEDVFLLSYIKNGDLYTAMTTPPYFKHQVSVPVHRVGILLDCEEGTISFYDALRKCFIYNFPHFPFPGPLRALFSPCPGIGEESGIPMTIRDL